ncbi:MAG: phosphate ABC transporter permease subunit PstC [Planctomycetes bacterium]|nr:phosphate ABC transporter permease subunit PstC [Planctomycetota bacterium]
MNLASRVTTTESGSFQPPAWSRFTPARVGDGAARALCWLAAAAVPAIALSLVVVLVLNSWTAWRSTGWSFLTSTVWDPEESHRQFGAMAFVFGTIVTSMIAMLVAVPLGVATAAYLCEIAPGWLRRPGSFLVEMLAAVPSVVYGFWGMYVLGPGLQKIVKLVGGPNFGGVGLLPAGLILAIMVLPYVTAVSADACRAVPVAQRGGALALGATRWQTIWYVVLPYARPGIIGACFIALGRAVGETMAVTMLVGNSPSIRFSLFAKGDTIASAIANQFAEATYDQYLSSLVALGLVLFAVTLLINLTARSLLRRVMRQSDAAARPASRRVSPLGPADGHSSGTPQGTSQGTTQAEASQQTMPRRADVEARRAGRELQGAAVRARRRDRIMSGVLSASFLVTVTPLFLILVYLIREGVTALNLDFFLKLPKPVGEQGGGLANAILGSLMLTGAAASIAVPIGLFAAVYLAEYRDRYLSPWTRLICELLGGVPSIVVGICAYAIVVRSSTALRGVPGWYGWAGVCALAILMIPIVLRASEEALKMVPDSLRQASYALGARKWQTLAYVVVPAAGPRIITAVFLALARIIGESAPLLLTAGVSSFWPRTLNDYTPSLPVFIFNYANSPYDDWHRQAWGAALVLLGAVMILNGGIRLIAGRDQSKLFT